MTKRFDLYSGIHKGLRGALFQVSVRIGELDWSDAAAVKATVAQWRRLVEFLHHHADNENRFVHPLANAADSEAVNLLEDEHRQQSVTLSELGMSLELALATDGDACLRFYRAWNLFVADFLRHLDFEERQFQESLWNSCSDERMAGALGAIIASLSAEDMNYTLDIMSPAVNLHECVGLLSGLRPATPPDVFQAYLDRVRSAVVPEKWTAITRAMGT